MPTSVNLTLSDGLQRVVEEIAREQDREPGEVLDDAVRRYANVQRLERLAERGEARAKALGISEEDIPRLIDELRREKRERGH